MDVDMLLIDLDDVGLPFPKEEYEAHARKVLQHFGYTLFLVTYAPSQNKGIHVTVFVKEPVEPLYVPLLQYLLGSDPKRECINYLRLKKGIDLNILFTSKRRYPPKGDAETETRLRIDRATPSGSSRFRMCVKNFDLCPGFKEMIELAERSGVRRYSPNPSTP